MYDEDQEDYVLSYGVMSDYELMDELEEQGDPALNPRRRGKKTLPASG